MSKTYVPLRGLAGFLSLDKASVYACTSKRKKKQSWPVSWSSEVFSAIPLESLLHGSLPEGSQEAGGPHTWAINSERPRIPCFPCEGSGWAARTDPARLPVFIGFGGCYWSGWQLSARLSETAFLCSLPLLNFTQLLFLLSLFLKIFPSCILIW